MSCVSLVLVLCWLRHFSLYMQGGIDFCLTINPGVGGCWDWGSKGNKEKQLGGGGVAMFYLGKLKSCAFQVLSAWSLLNAGHHNVAQHNACSLHNAWGCQKARNIIRKTWGVGGCKWKCLLWGKDQRLTAFVIIYAGRLPALNIHIEFAFWIKVSLASATRYTPLAKVSTVAFLCVTLDHLYLICTLKIPKAKWPLQFNSRSPIYR